MKKILYISSLLLFAATANAQQLEQWTMFGMNEYLVNPASIGTERYFEASAMYRDQWAGITGAPRTYFMNVQGPVWKENMGIGGAVFSDITGAQQRSGIQLSYAYHLKLQTDMKLSFSLSAAYVQLSTNGSELGLQNNNDIAISNGGMQFGVPDFAASARFAYKGFHAGIHVPQITNARLAYFDDYNVTDSRLNRHYYLNLGYKRALGSDFAIEANYLGRYVKPVDMMEVNVRGIYKEMVSLGAAFRMPVITDQLPSSVGMFLGYQFQNNLGIAYCYEMVLPNTSLGVVSYGSHEIMLSIRFSKKNNKPLIQPE